MYLLPLQPYASAQTGTADGKSVSQRVQGGWQWKGRVEWEGAMRTQELRVSRTADAQEADRRQIELVGEGYEANQGRMTAPLAEPHWNGPLDW